MLLLLAETYEEAAYPVELPDPVAALLPHGARGPKAQDPIPYIGSKSKVWSSISPTEPATIKPGVPLFRKEPSCVITCSDSRRIVHGPRHLRRTVQIPARQTTHLVEDYHGTKVPDPYRWLEDDVRKSAEVKTWVEEENQITNAYLKTIPQREPIRKRLTELWNYERYSAPSKIGGRYFFRKNDGLQNQAVLYTQDSLDDPPRVLLNPNEWTKDGTIALGDTAVSPDAKYLAYSTSEAGSDWQTWKVLDIATAKPLSDEIKWVKFSDVSWTPDEKGFFYSRYPEPQKGVEFQSLNKNQHVMYHRIGTPQADDVLVYRRTDKPDWGFGAGVSDDGRYLILSTWVGTDHKNRFSYKDLSEPYGTIIDIADNFDLELSFIDNDGPIFYVKTDWNAPNGRVIAIDIRKPQQENWKEIIPQAKEKLSSIDLVGNLFVAGYLKDAKSQVKVFSPDGEFIREVVFPGIGTASGFGGRRADTETFYLFSSYATPPSIYRYDLLTGKSKLWRQSKVKFNPDEYEVDQVFSTSKDGTRIPMFISHKKGLKLDGSNPTLLYGYGGFNISLTPSFSVSIVDWMEMGGIYVVANLRGGGEYGNDWHKAGTKLHKQNVFDDFIGAAEYLIREKYTSTPKLAIKGGSNGGLLIGAVMTQRAGLVWGLFAARRCDGHAPIQPVHRRTVLDRRLRQFCKSRRVQGTPRPIRPITISKRA